MQQDTAGPAQPWLHPMWLGSTGSKMTCACNQQQQYASAWFQPCSVVCAQVGWNVLVVFTGTRG
jgi:hypothetical protein